MAARYVVQSYRFIDPHIIGEFDTMEEAQACMRSNLYTGGVGLSIREEIPERPTPDITSDRIFDVIRSFSGG